MKSARSFQHEEHLRGIGLFSLTRTTGYKSDFRLQIQFPDSAQQRMDFECQCLYIVAKQFDDLLESLRPSQILRHENVRHDTQRKYIFKPLKRPHPSVLKTKLLLDRLKRSK